jgi:outer membrane receptor protein involved in Fe transport
MPVKRLKHIFWKYILLISIVFLLADPADLYAQLYGKVIDDNTKEPLVGANIYLLINKIGTVSDEEGRFVLSVTGKVMSDTLLVNYLGYEEYRTALRDFENYTVISLQPKSLTLNDAIQIYAERMDLARQEIPHSRFELDVEELERYGASEISDLFKKMPSVRIEGNDLDGRFLQIRGSNAGEVNVYLDGILINDLSYDNAADLSMIPTESIYKLEVMKGSSLPLLGNGAFGGVVNIISKKQVDPGFLIKTKFGDFNTKQYIGNISVPVYHKLFINYFGQYAQMSPTIEYFPGERFTEKTENYNIEVNKQNHNIILDYYNDLGQFSAKFFTYIFDYEKPSWINNRKNFLFSLSYNSQNDLSLLISNLYSINDVNRYTVESTQYISQYETQRLNVKLSKKFNYQSAGIQFISEYLHDELKDLSKLKDRESTRKFFQTNLYNNRTSIATVFSFNDAYDSLGNISWKTFLGLRGDLVASGEKDLTVYSGAQLKWHRNNWILEPHINYGKNVRYPTLLESAYVQDLLTYTSTDTNIQLLKPEYNNSFELGADLNYNFISDYLRNIKINLAYFYSTSYNKILKRPFGDVIAQSQIGHNTTKGIEGSIKFESILNRMSFTASYINLDIENRLLYEYKPERNYNFQLEYAQPKGLYCTLIYFFDGKSYAWYYDNNNQLTTDKIDECWDLDASIGYRLNIFGLEFNLHIAGYNLLDNSGYDYFYLKKRNLQAGLSIKY